MSVNPRRGLALLASIAAAALLAGCTIPAAGDSGPAGDGPAAVSSEPGTASAAPEGADTAAPEGADTAAPEGAVPAAAEDPAALPLAGRVVFLDPGHSGYTTAAASDQVPTGRGGTKNCQTTGTSTDAGYPEHTAVFEIAEVVRADLEARGARVVLSRSDDASPELCNNQRAAAADEMFIWMSPMRLSPKCLRSSVV